MSVRWCAIHKDGKLHRGEGPSKGLNPLLEQCTALAVQVPGMPPAVVAEPWTVVWTVEGALGKGELQRFWGLRSLQPDARLYLWPDGSMVGLGRSVEAIEAARALLFG